jgi:hypothetical protein
MDKGSEETFSKEDIHAKKRYSILLILGKCKSKAL